MAFEEPSVLTARETTRKRISSRVPSARLQERWRPERTKRKFVWPELPAALHETQPWGKAGVEPSLGELLADPSIRAVMRCDGVTAASLEAIIDEAKRRMQMKSGDG